MSDNLLLSLSRQGTGYNRAGEKEAIYRFLYIGGPFNGVTGAGLASEVALEIKHASKNGYIPEGNDIEGADLERIREIIFDHAW